MIAERMRASGSATGMLVPGTFCVDEVRNASSVLSSHVSPELAIAAE